jgi:hypothetical protein
MWKKTLLAIGIGRPELHKGEINRNLLQAHKVLFYLFIFFWVDGCG